MRKEYGISLIGIMVTIIILASCAGQPLKVEPVPKSENPSTMLENLGQALADAKQERVNLLSPTWFESARASYDKAKQGIDKGTELSGILENLATGQAQLQQARIYAGKCQKALGDVIQSRDAAITARANQYEKEFNRLEADFRKLAEAVEENDMGYVGSKKKTVNNTYRALELRAIKSAYLGQARQLMQTAQSQELDEIAPKSFLIAQSKLADAEAVINQDRYAKDKIAAAVQEAEFFGQRLQQIAKVCAQYEKMAPEDIALLIEHYFAQTITHLKQADGRNLSFDEQQKVVLDGISDMQRNQFSMASQLEARNIEIEKLKQRIGDQEGRAYQERADKERLAADKERLAAEKEFNELYNKVQSYFSADQAEVYKKGLQLVIRLKAIQFPVGQAVIMPANYPLLNTVQKAVDTFGKPEVVIEGHTDSTGSEVKNQSLSHKRAEAVKQYLIYNGTLPADKISAVGYGSARPLASNASAKGRAINRRIDVVIKPIRN